MDSFSGILAGCKHKQALTLLLLFWAIFTQGQSYTDISLEQSASPAVASIGDTLTFSIQIFNEGKSDLTGLTIQTEIPATVAYLSHISFPNTTFDVATNTWDIGNEMTASIPTMTLTIKVLAMEEGVVYHLAQVQTLNEIDVDSEPGNDFLPEDDMQAACVSIPHTICTANGESVTLTAASGFGGYEWYHDDGSGPALVSTEQIFVASLPGNYTYVVSGSACPQGLCCPIILEEACGGFFDLSLEKTLMPGQPSVVDLGDSVAYQIIISNEGNAPAYNVQITDFIPDGLALWPTSLGWDIDALGNAIYTIPGPIMPNESVTLEVIMQVMYGASEAAIWNTAEVTAATDIDGVPGEDIDSTPDNGNEDEDDQDGTVIQLEPHDPTGYIYCENTGELVTGGQITVSGPGEIFIISDGSTGYYEFFTDGTPGVYQLQYLIPSGYLFSNLCLSQPGAFDPTGLSGPVVLGAGALAGVLADLDCSANPYYLFFELEPGDPFIFNNNIPLVCPSDLIVEDTVVVQANCGFGDPLFCFDVPYDELPNYSFQLNGQPYDAEFGPCDYLRERYYALGALAALGNGNYKLDHWSVNGQSHTTPFQNLEQLISMMNLWDPTGDWALDPQTVSLKGGARQSYYSSITVTDLTVGTIYNFTLYQFYAPNSSYVILPEGENDLVITRLDNGVTDTVHIRAFCVTPEHVEMTMPVGAADTICFDLSELSGGAEAIFNTCLSGIDNPAEFEVMVGGACIEVFGMFPGETEACYVVCDGLGVCDTTYILISVYDEDLHLIPDSLCTPKNVPVIGEVLLNDHINSGVLSVSVIDPPSHGTVLVNPDNTITYLPDEGYCNDGENEPLDQFTYEVCTQFECESAIVTVQVKCDGLIVYNAFSPNGDGVNDTFKIDGLNAYDTHKLMVFNRWGNKVFQSVNYHNDWDGHWKSKRLPVGTYFYLIELNAGETWMSGYLQIMW